MGADYDFFTIDKLGKAAVKPAFEETKRDRQYEYGHGGYTGTIAETHGVVIHKGLFSPQAAHDYIYKNAEKWENAIAVMVFDVQKARMYWLVGACCSC